MCERRKLIKNVVSSPMHIMEIAKLCNGLELKESRPGRVRGKEQVTERPSACRLSNGDSPAVCIKRGRHHQQQQQKAFSLAARRNVVH
jgi:hypothetical protein